MKYFVNEVEVDEVDFQNQLEDAIRDYVEDHYDDLIDEENDEVCIWGLTYSPSEVLKVVDPIAYRCGKDDYVDCMFKDAWYEFEDDDYEEKYGDVLFRSENV